MALLKPFNAAQFTDDQFSTAADKAKFANHFVNFLARGCPLSLFTKGFYTRLSMLNGHSAEYNLHGFHFVWFSTPAARATFVERWAHPQMCWFGRGDWGAVERALRDYLRESDLPQQVAAEAAATQDASELAVLRVLVARHPEAARALTTEE